MNILAFKFTPAQFFAVIAIAAGLAISYFPPPTNGAAIWGLISVFLGYGVRDLFISHTGSAEVPATPPANSEAGFARISAMLLLSGLAIASLAGCSMLSPVVDKAEEKAATAVVQSAERTICRDIPVGTWQREYGTSAARAQAWRDLCAEPAEVPTNKSIEAPK